MPSYDIRYLNDDGSLKGEASANLQNELHAKVLAHALMLKGTRRLEVWDGESLVYERPLRAH